MCLFRPTVARASRLPLPSNDQVLGGDILADQRMILFSPEDLRAILGVFGYFVKDEQGFWEELTDEFKAQDEVLVKLVPRPNEGGTFRLNSYEPLISPRHTLQAPDISFANIQ